MFRIGKIKHHFEYVRFDTVFGHLEPGITNILIINNKTKATGAGKNLSEFLRTNVHLYAVYWTSDSDEMS